MSSSHHEHPRAWLALAWTAVCLPGIVLYALLTPRAVNIPIWDDYDAVLNYLTLLTQRPTLASKWF